MDVVTGLRRIGQLRTPPGASGGAGVTERGVIGIVLQDATDSSWLLPVERIIELFTAWDLPVNLLISPQAVSSTEVGTPSGPRAGFTSGRLLTLGRERPFTGRRTMWSQNVAQAN